MKRKEIILVIELILWGTGSWENAINQSAISQVGKAVRICPRFHDILSGSPSLFEKKLLDALFISESAHLCSFPVLGGENFQWKVFGRVFLFFLSLRSNSLFSFGEYQGTGSALWYVRYKKPFSSPEWKRGEENRNHFSKVEIRTPTSFRTGRIEL